jgi:hypothetical protein
MPPRLHLGDIVLTELPRIQRGDGFTLVWGMIGERVGHNQHALLIDRCLHVVMLVKASIVAVLHDARRWVREVVLDIIAI